MNLEQTRFNLIEQQIRPWGVLDITILELLYKIRREEFAPAPCHSLAFVDMEISLGYGQVMLTPKMEARILQELQVNKTDNILEIGSGSGYQAALLADKGAHVYSVEIVPELRAMAEKNLRDHGIDNVTIEQGDGAHGWSTHGPYDIIVITASTPVLPEAFKKDLNPGGRLFAIVGEEPVMEALLVTCVAPCVYSTRVLFETCTAPLANAQLKEKFVF